MEKLWSNNFSPCLPFNLCGAFFLYQISINLETKERKRNEKLFLIRFQFPLKALCKCNKEKKDYCGRCMQGWWDTQSFKVDQMQTILKNLSRFSSCFAQLYMLDRRIKLLIASFNCFQVALVLFYTSLPTNDRSRTFYFISFAYSFAVCGNC